jgi:hypothetical protein
VETKAMRNELLSAAASLCAPGATVVDKLSAELMRRAAQALTTLQRAPLPATAVTDLLPIMQDGWAIEDYATWIVRAAERAHGIGGDFPNPTAPSWAEAPEGYNYRAMDSDGHWWWFIGRPYTETFLKHEGWDSEEGMREARGIQIYPNWKGTLQVRPEKANG